VNFLPRSTNDDEGSVDVDNSVSWGPTNRKTASATNRSQSSADFISLLRQFDADCYAWDLTLGQLRRSSQQSKTCTAFGNYLVECNYAMSLLKLHFYTRL